MGDPRPIGIFDSGVGGLTVFKEIEKILPNESTVYLGDTKHLPYGDKSKEAIIRFSIENTKFLLKHNIKALVIACNSASSVATDILKEMFKIPIIDVITPTIKYISNYKHLNSTLVIGTIRTIESGIYRKKISEKANIEIYQKACPLFVPFVEEGAFLEKNSFIYKALENTIHHYLYEFKGKIDSLVLACTHYPMIKDMISEILGNIKIIDPSELTGIELKNKLLELGMQNDSREKTEKFFVTDLSERVISVSKIILGRNIDIQEVYFFDE